MAEAGGVAGLQRGVAGAVKKPQDPEAQGCTKQTGTDKQEGGGYTRPVAETVPEEPREPGAPTRALLSAGVRQPATGSDEAGREQTVKAQAETGLDKPAELSGEGASSSAEE